MNYDKIVLEDSKFERITTEPSPWFEVWSLPRYMVCVATVYTGPEPNILLYDYMHAGTVVMPPSLTFSLWKPSILNAANASLVIRPLLS